MTSGVATFLSVEGVSVLERRRIKEISVNERSCSAELRQCLIYRQGGRDEPFSKTGERNVFASLTVLIA